MARKSGNRENFMATDKHTPGRERPEPEHLLEENRHLAQRYLELENTTRRQIEKLRSANEILAKGEAHMRLLLENAAIGFALLDLNMRVVNVNHTLCSTLGYSLSELSGDNFNNYVYVGALPAFSKMTGQSAGRVTTNETVELVARDGRLVPCRVAVSDWLDDDGAARGTFILVFNIDGEMRAAARLHDLERAMAEAQKARALFLDVVARELRTPAGGIMGMIRMLMDDDLTERQAELAGVIHSSASSLARLVDDIVDVARIDSGDTRPSLAPFHPTELAEGVANLFGVRTEEKGLELRVNVAAAVPERVVGDASRVRRVLTHLLDNALKFTDRGHIAVSVDVVGDGLRFMVSDTGGGISVEPGRDILADGMPSDSPSARRHGGVGLGLSLCRRLVGLMGGKIAYETDPGRGSEFHFTIPLAIPAAEAVDGKLEPPPEAIRLAPLSILLADGNPLSQGMVKAYLQFDGHDLTIVDNGPEAAERCRNRSFDLALVDLHLPKLDGVQTLRLIRDEEKATGKARLPVLFLAPPGLLKGMDYRKAGADGVVKKPIQPVDLMSATAAAVGVKPLAVARQQELVQYAAETSGASLRRIDGAQLVNLKQVMPSEQFLSILRFFMEDAVPGIIGLSGMAAAPELDGERIAFSAGKARGMAGYLGCTALADLLKRLETACRERASVETVRALAGELPMVMDDTLEELKRILPAAFSTISAMSEPPREGSEPAI